MPRPRRASARALNLDLTQQLVDYGAYHAHPLNQVRFFEWWRMLCTQFDGVWWA